MLRGPSLAVAITCVVVGCFGLLGSEVAAQIRQSYTDKISLLVGFVEAPFDVGREFATVKIGNPSILDVEAYTGGQARQIRSNRFVTFVPKEEGLTNVLFLDRDENVI